MEAGGYCGDRRTVRCGLHHPQRQRPSQVHPPVRCAVEASQEHPHRPRMGDQRYLGHSRAPGTEARSERQISAARQRPLLHTGAQPLQRRERAEKC